MYKSWHVYCVYVVVNFLISGIKIFDFILFGGMAMLLMKLKQGKMKITWDKKLTTTTVNSFNTAKKDVPFHTTLLRWNLNIYIYIF